MDINSVLQGEVLKLCDITNKLQISTKYCIMSPGSLKWEYHN